MDLSPDEFWRLTLVELLDQAEAHWEYERQRQEAEYHRTAWLAVNLMNAMGTLKRPVTVEDLLKKEKKTEKERLSSDGRKKQLEDLKRKFSL